MLAWKNAQKSSGTATLKGSVFFNIQKIFFILEVRVTDKIKYLIAQIY